QRGRRLLLSDDHQDHVFRRAGASLCPHAAGAQGRARGHRPVQPLVPGLSGAAARRSHGGGQIAVLMTLDHTPIRACVRLAMFDTLGSTKGEALARARRGERGPLWIVARRQTAGRGRRGRVWVSEPGNLYATLLVTDPSPPPRAAELSFVAALAVTDALAEIAPALAPPSPTSDS